MKIRGFTLIEIAIVLVIIGLLAGGILKGQQMIENAKYKAWVKEIDAYRTAVLMFKDKYGYLPGDFPRAQSKLPAVENVTYKNGNGDGLIDNGGCPLVNSCEASAAIIHLRAAGLVVGDVAATSSQTPAPVGGSLWAIVNATAGTAAAADRRLFITYFDVPSQFAKRLDEEFDDGKGQTGAILNYAGTAFVTGLQDWPGDDQLARVYVLL